MERIEYCQTDKFQWIAKVKITGEVVGVVQGVEIISSLKIERFAVKEQMRGKGIGRELYALLKTEVAQNLSINEIIVYPHSETLYEGESSLNMNELYAIYEKIGFEFVESRKGDSIGQKMICTNLHI